MRRPHFLRAATTACTAVAALACLAPVGGAAAASAPAGFKPFAPDSIWNLPLRADAPLSSSSDRYVAWLQGQVAAKGGWINSTQCGMPLYWADASTPKVNVTLDHPSYMDPALVRAWSAVPIPSDAAPANCSDHNFSVAQVQPDGKVKEWEFWAATKRADGSWVAQWGGAMSDMRTDRGAASSLTWQDLSAPTWLERYATSGWNVTASSISQNAGVITQADLRAGHIDHAVAMALSNTASGKWMWPAQRTDGSSSDAAALPEGARLRIDPSVDLTKLSMTPLVRMIAEAAQTYGIVVRDRTYSSDVFYTEPPAPGAADPVGALLGGQWANQALKAFPWDGLQVLDAPLCTDYRGCSVTPTARIDVDGTPAPGTSVTLDTSNSVLDQPRSKVEWDLDGNGTYETAGGTAVKQSVTAGPAGTQTVGVRITTLDGRTVTATKSFTVAAGAESAPPAARGPSATVIVRPTDTPTGVKGSPPAGASQTAPLAGAPAGPTATATPAAAVTVAPHLAVAARGSILRLPLRCVSKRRRCAGVATVRLAARLRTPVGTLAKGTRLSSVRFTIPAGSRRTLRLRLTRKVAHRLRGAKVRRLAVAPVRASRSTTSVVVAMRVPVTARR